MKKKSLVEGACSSLQLSLGSPLIRTLFALFSPHFLSPLFLPDALSSKSSRYLHPVCRLSYSEN